MKKVISSLLLIAIVISCFSITCNAYEYAPYYKGSDYYYNNGNGYHYADITWSTGALWWKHNYKEYYYNTNAYKRCLSYYEDWVLNQGQILTISKTKTRSTSVSSTVSSEIGVDDVVACKIGSSISTEQTITYSSTMGLTYNLNDFARHRSYRIASMGFIEKFKVYQYRDDYYQKSYYAY